MCVSGTASHAVSSVSMRKGHDHDQRGSLTVTAKVSHCNRSGNSDRIWAHFRSRHDRTRRNVCRSGVDEQPTDHIIYNPSLGNGIMDGFPPPKEKLVTRDNWAEDPLKRRWALRHMRELFPTQPIPRGSGPVRVLPANPTDISEWSIPDGRGGKQTRLKTWLERTHTDASFCSSR